MMAKDLRKNLNLAGLAPALLLLVLLAACGAKVTTYDDKPIGILKDPVQEAVDNPMGIQIEKGGWKFTLTPKAEYTLRGILLHRESYHTRWNSKLSPCDVAIAWGPLAMNGLWKEVHWSQSGRWYWWRYGSDFNYDNAFIARYSSNNHIIPATDNVKRALSQLKKGRKVELKGLLVYVEGKKGERKVWWHSSLSRTDRGNGSCEVLYLHRIKVNGAIYE